jgi:ferredoxin
MHKIIHYRHKCIGCNICFELQPALWRMSRKDGKATLIRAVEKTGIYSLTSHAPPRDTEFVAKACPVKAIQVVS